MPDYQNAKLFELRAVAVAAVKAKPWIWGKWRNEPGFPTITDVPSGGGMPAHGEYDVGAGTVVVNSGEWVASDDAGGYAVYGAVELTSKYTQVCNCPQ